jgi:CheY-like chemotaxis protein
MPQPRFLIVEDSPVVRLTIRTALTRSGVDEACIAEAETAVKAIEEFERARPDVAFVDISLPVGTPAGQRSEGIFGFLAAGASAEDGGLRAAGYMMEHHPALKLIVCTGNSPEDPRVRGLVKEGAFHVLTKPLKSPELHEAVQRVRAELDGSAANAGPRRNRT